MNVRIQEKTIIKEIMYFVSILKNNKAAWVEKFLKYGWGLLNSCLDI